MHRNQEQRDFARQLRNEVTDAEIESDLKERDSRKRAPRWRVSAEFLPALVLASTSLALLFVLGESLWTQRTTAAAPTAGKKLDPADWGSDHVGQPLPEYMESGECLFCHRMAVGSTWGGEKHNRTIREPKDNEPALAALKANPATKDLAAAVQFVMGDNRALRFLKRNEGYGKADLLSVGATLPRPGRATLVSTENPHWDTETFARECAGCHTTAVNPETHAFVALALDCYTCHGDAPVEHANDPKLISLSKSRKDSPAVVTSICASCHVRFGKSKASGLPYPTNFVAGDNLFKDFQVDFSKADDPQLNPADRHVLDNIRDVVVNGNESTTCLTCHDVHARSTKKHRDLPVVQSCQHCHDAGTPIKGHKQYEVHSERCKY